MAALLHGRLDRAGYVALLANLQAIYIALESGLARHRCLAEPLLAPLRRAEALALDLQALSAHGPLPALAPATERYVRHLHELAGTAAGGAPPLLAHAYVRYLGDLHGGQLLGKRVALTLELDGCHGTRFYDFGPTEAVGRLIQELRSALDAAARDAAQGEALVAEARLAFGLHIDLFEQLSS